ncbi:MAG: hypothetical protein AAFU61_17925 [Pseudomonadota bacterium]
MLAAGPAVAQGDAAAASRGLFASDRLLLDAAAPTGPPQGHRRLRLAAVSAELAAITGARRGDRRDGSAAPRREAGPGATAALRRRSAERPLS